MTTVMKHCDEQSGINLGGRSGKRAVTRHYLFKRVERSSRPLTHELIATVSPSIEKRNRDQLPSPVYPEYVQG